MEKIISLKNGMNSNREIFTFQNTKSQIRINPNWFIGFIEGECTFGFKTGSALYLQVASFFFLGNKKDGKNKKY